MARLLFGPCDDPAWIDSFLHIPLAAGRWGFFSARTPSWDAALAQMPGGPPDAVAVWPSYASVPAWVWSAPVPVVMLAADANLLWSGYRHLLPLADLVLTDAPSAGRMRRAGIGRVRALNMYGLDRHLAAGIDQPEGVRDIDLLFVGNVNPATQAERLPWLGRVAALAGRHRVLVTAGVFGAEYRALLRRARLVFNRSVRGECNLRALEAAASGAVLLQEAENEEVREYLRPGEEYAPYTAEDFEEVVERLLAAKPKRRAISDAAKERARGLVFDALVEKAMAVGGEGWGEVLERARERVGRGAVLPLAGRVWQRAALGGVDADPDLMADLATAGDRHALGVFARSPAEAETHLAAAAGEGNRVSALGHAAALAQLGRRGEAAAELKDVLAALEVSALTAAECDSVPYPCRFDPLRVGWERAGFDHPGDPQGEAEEKARLLRGQALRLFAECTSELEAYRAAAEAWPNLPAARASYGCALARDGRFAEAARELLAAWEANPLDRSAARAAIQALADSGDEAGKARLASRLRLFSEAAPALAPPEPWFAPTGAELASIIVLCCNELGVTRLCVESVLAHTRKPYELVFIDNGSIDGTGDYLESLKGCAGPERMVVIHNPENRGYPAGVNQGLAAARGEYLVTLNNDVVVTPRWLERLTRCAAHGWPSVGLAGAVTNYAPPPQLVEPGYSALNELDAFADRHASQFAGQAIETPRLTGFCLLARRELFARIGRLDESFGLGFFDDDDLCIRARKAGFKMAVVLDCYVHHFGSRTFRGLGVDTAKQLKENLALYQAKWGAEEAAKYRVPQEMPVAQAETLGDVPVIVSAPPAPRVTVPAAVGKPRVSLTMIVKNEEEHLPDCLRSVRDLVDEAVLIDTGSTDRTVEVAKSFGCKVGYFPWVDHFAAARNAALEAATGDYAFWMDADDRLDDDNRAKLKALLESLPAGNAAFVMKCLCVGDPEAGSGAALTAVDHVRLFRLHPAHRWTYRVHEQILPALRATGAEVGWSDVYVLHVGYVDAAVRRRKLDRDLRLLKLDEAERPEDPFTLFNLGSVYHERGDFPEAARALEGSLAGSHVKDSIVRKAYALLARCHAQGGDPRKAGATCRRARTHYPDDAELVFLSAGYAREAGDPGAAEGLYRKLINGSEGPHFASVDTGLRAVKGRHNLAVLLLDQNRLREAEGLWRAALSHDPTFLPAHVGLGELYVKAGDGAGVERQAAALEEMGEAGAAEAAILVARWKASQGDHAGADALLLGAVERMPRSLGLRVALSHARIGANAPPEKLEEAFKGVLEIDPANAQARYNLEALYRNTGRWVEGVLDPPPPAA